MSEADTLTVGHRQKVARYPVAKAHWNYYMSEEGMEFCFRAECGFEVSSDADFNYVQQPHVEVSARVREEDCSRFLAGEPIGPFSNYDPTLEHHVASIYYCEHLTPEDVVIQCESQEGDRLRIAVTMKSEEIEWDVDDRFDSRILLRAWFTKNGTLERSFQ